ncbi:MAG: sensor histidine kinase [Pseudomonadota bacterium]
MNTTLKTPSSVARWKAFNLVYLLYYFMGWFFVAPTFTDVAAITFALAIFLPVYATAFEGSGNKYLPHIAIMEILSWVLSPFAGIHGVFHVYACVQAAFQRPSKRAIALIAGLTVCQLIFSLVTKQNPYNAFFSLMIGILTSIACIGAASGMERERRLKRSQVLERQRARVAERERIAHDLHDLLGHTLTMVALKSDVADKLMDKDPERARGEIRHVAQAARDALKDIRAAVYDMTVTTVDAEIEMAKRALDAAGVSLEVRNSLPPLSPPVGKALGLTIREAATNIVRHANASTAVIAFDTEGETLQLVVSDNGTGSTKPSSGGSGLAGLKKRIAELGGETAIEQVNGMRISVTLPLDRLATGTPE